jgi:short-subunit dehydrogenase
MKKILILGASSAVAEQTARYLTKEGTAFFLVGGRRRGLVQSVAEDLGVRGATIAGWEAADLSVTSSHGPILERSKTALGSLDLVLIAYGMLPDQKECERSFPAAKAALQTNFLSVVSLLTLLANEMERQGHGTIAVLSSVAGDRGRRSNYVYGAAKGGVTLFLQGLRSRLDPKGVRVITIHLGPVDTPMTAHLRGQRPMVSASKAAHSIYHAILAGKDVAYVPWFWRPIMAILKGMPERVMKRLNL